MAEKKTTTNNRDAGTGKFVSGEFAKANKKTTTTEHNPRNSTKSTAAKIPKAK